MSKENCVHCCQKTSIQPLQIFIYNKWRKYLTKEPDLPANLITSKRFVLFIHIAMNEFECVCQYCVHVCSNV